MKILDACEVVLKEAAKPMTASELHSTIESKGLFQFKAKDPVAIVRGTLRKHIRGSGPHRVAEAGRGQFSAS